MKKTLIIILTLCAAAATAHPKQRVAVLPSVGDLEPQGLILLTDRVREIATKNLPMEHFNILKQDVITKLIGEEELYRSCKEGVCIGDLARKTNANYGARCDVVKFNNSLVLKFELYSVNEDAIFETFTDYSVKDFYGMLDVLEKRLPGAFQKMITARNADNIVKMEELQRQRTEKLRELENIRERQRQQAEKQQALEIAREQQRQEAERQQALEMARGQQKQTKTQQEKKLSRKLEKGTSIEGGGIGGLSLQYKHESDWREEAKKESGAQLGVGLYIRLDLIYVELAFDNIDDDEDFDRIMSGILLKYPIGNEVIKVSPVLGFGFTYPPNVYPWVVGGRIDVGISEIAYFLSECLYIWGEDDLRKSGTMLLKIGGGLDIGFGERKRAYLRSELRYNFISGGESYDAGGDRDAYKETLQYLELRLGIGYKWGGGKRKSKLYI